MVLPVAGSFIIRPDENQFANIPIPIQQGVNYYRSVQDVPIIAEHANIYVTENITQNVYRSVVRQDIPDFITANAVATSPPAGRQVGAVYFDASENILYAWNGTAWYKVGENINNTVNGNVTVNGNLQSYNIITGNLTGTNIFNTGNTQTVGLISGGSIISQSTIQATGNVSGANLITNGDVYSANVFTSGNVSASNVQVSGNIDGGNLNAAGNINAAGTITGGNIATPGTLTSGNVQTGNLTVSGDSLFQGPVTFDVMPTFTTSLPNTVMYINSAQTMVSGPELSFDGANFGIGIQPATYNFEVNGNGRSWKDFSVLGTGDGLTIMPKAAGFGSSIVSRNQSFSGFAPLEVISSPAHFKPDGLNANGLYISTTGIGANTTLPVSEMDINGVLSVTRAEVAPLDLRPNDDASVNWRFGAHTTAMKQGVLQLQNFGTGVGGGGTEAMTVDQENNFGFGTVGPFVQYNISNPNARINVNGSITGGTDASMAGSVILQGRNGPSGATTNFGSEFGSGGPVMSYGMIPSTAASGAFDSAYSPTTGRSAITVNDGVRIYTSEPSTVGIGSPVTIDHVFTVANDGKVGIQKAVPLYDLDVDGNAMVNLQTVGDYSGVRGAAGGNASMMLQSDQTGGTQFWMTSKTDSTLHIGGVGGVEPAQGAMVIDGGGNVVVGSAIAPAKLGVIGVANNKTFYAMTDSGIATDVPITAYNAAGAGDNMFIDFVTEGAPVSRGSISFNRAAVQVAYNVTSDYRAKELLGTVVDSGSTIDALNVYNGRMHGATLEKPMLVAHEAQAVVPYAVTGEKDAVDSGGNPVYQQVDHASLVPLLIAEIQSLRKRINDLERR